MFFNGLIAHLFLVLNNIPLSWCTTVFIHSPIREHLGFAGFYVGIIPRSMIIRLYGKSMFSTVKKKKTAKLSSKVVVPFSIPTSNE